MNHLIKKFTPLAMAAVLLAPAALLAQKEEVKEIEITTKGDKGEKGEKGSKNEDKRIVMITTDGKEKDVKIEINGEEVLVNGKKIDKDDKNIKVKVMKVKDSKDLLSEVTVAGHPMLRTRSIGGQNNFSWSDVDENRAMLGVSTDNNDKGAEIVNVTDKSAAEKAGLEKGDIITKVDDKKIETPADLTAAIKDKKPGDKITIHYTRDKKDRKVTAELGKWKGPMAMNFNFNTDKIAMGRAMEDYQHKMGELQELELRRPFAGAGAPAFEFNWNDNSARLGLSVQETEDGKGVKVLEVDEESNGAKAGIKENDIILSIDGKEVNTTEKVREVMKDAKTKISVPMELLRNGNKMNLDVKIPRKLKKAEI